MSSQTLADRYLALQTACSKLRTMLSGDGGTAMRSQQQALQNQFQALLASATPDQQQALQRYNTEIHKEIQLLAADIPRWMVAKQLETREKRSLQIRQRCDRLDTYFDRARHLLSAKSDDPTCRS